MPDDLVEIQVLGPLRAATAGGVEVTPTGALQRRLLALLVLQRGHVVSVDSAVEALWPVARPADPVASLQNHMFRLRRALPAGVIRSVGEGYRLDPTTVDVDADRLATVVAGGGSGGLFDELSAIIDRWEGPAYPELADHEDGRIEATRLEELRVRARELRIEATLRRGSTDGLAAELTALVDELPLRERPRALLMEVLIATGRRAEALRVYDDFRRLLGEELGIEPSPELSSLHADVLDGVAGSTWTPPLRVPVPLSRLVGRDQALSDAIAAVETGRLVTLVGPGGVGKTRLLVELGRRLLDVDPDRAVSFCGLAATEPSTAVVAVAASLGIDDRPGVPVHERVVEVVGGTELVLLLDNCEHVLDVIVPFVEVVLASCAGVSVVATSRERLRIPGELLCTVPPLAFDGAGSSAATLFVERATAAVGAAPTDMDQVEEIVRRVDGLPLAIELAAARMHTHSLDEIVAGLDSRFTLLTGGSRSSSRHTSLGAAVSWSFDVLPSDLQQVFAALSSFAGPFDVAGAAAVADLRVEQAPMALAELAERSLVMRTANGRHVLLETLRAFGAEHLARRGETDLVRGRHAAHIVGLTEDADRRLVDPDGPGLAVIDASLVESRRALDWLLDQGELDAAGCLATALWQFGFFRLRPDVLSWSRRVAEADPDDRCARAPELWGVAAYAAWMAGDLDETGRCAQRAVAVAEGRGERCSAIVASAVGSHALFEGRLDDAATWFHTSEEQARDRGLGLQSASARVLALGYAFDPTAPAVAAQLLADAGDESTPYTAYAWYCAGEAVAATDPPLARARYARALGLADITGASIVTGLAGASKASIDAQSGDPVAVAADYRALIGHWQRAGMWSTQWTMLRSVAVLLSRLGSDHDAAVLEGAVRSPRAGHRIFGADAEILDGLTRHLRTVLGDDAYDDAVAHGATLDGAAAVEHALRVLSV